MTRLLRGWSGLEPLTHVKTKTSLPPLFSCVVYWNTNNMDILYLSIPNYQGFYETVM